MRFDRINPEVWARLGNSLGNAYAQGQAGDAYKNATQQQENASGADAAQNFRDKYQAPQNDVYNAPTEGPQYATADEYMAANPEQFKGLQGRQRSYTMGGQEQADKFSPLQVRNAGNQALGDYWSSRGDVERGLKYQEAADTGQAAQDAHATVGLRNQVYQGQLNAQPEELQKLKYENVSMKVKSEIDQALAGGKERSFGYYNSNNVPDGFHVESIKNAAGGYDLVQFPVGADHVTPVDGGERKVMQSFNGMKDTKGNFIITPDQEQDAYIHREMGRPENQDKLIALRLNEQTRQDQIASNERQHADSTATQRAIYASKAEKRQTAAEVMQDKAEGIAAAYRGADPTLTKGAAMQRAYQVLTKDPAGSQAAMHPEMQKEYMNKRYELLSTPAKTDVQKAEQENSLRALDTAFGVTLKGATPGGWAAAVAAENEKAKTRDTTMPAGSRMRSGLGSNVPEPIVFPPGFKYDPKEPQIPFKPGDAAVDDMIYGNHRR